MSKYTTYALILCLFLIWGCAQYFKLGSATQVRPYDIGRDITVKELVKRSSEFNLYYSGKIFNPGAILFIPKEKENPYKLKLLIGWYPVEGTTNLEALVDNIELHDYYRYKPYLYALLTPPQPETGEKKFLGYIYTYDFVSMRPAEDPRTYALRSVPEPKKSIYYGNGDFDGDH